MPRVIDSAKIASDTRGTLPYDSADRMRMRLSHCIVKIDDAPCMVVSDGRNLRYVKIGPTPKKSFIHLANDASESKERRTIEPNTWPEWLSIDFRLGYTNLSPSGEKNFQPVWFTRTTTNNRATHGLGTGNLVYERPDGTSLAFSVESQGHMTSLAFMLHSLVIPVDVFLGKDKPAWCGLDAALSKDIALFEKPVDRRAYEIHYRRRPVGLLMEGESGWEVMHTSFKMTPVVFAALEEVGLASEGILQCQVI